MYTAEGWAAFFHSPLILYTVKCPVRFHETDCIFEFYFLTFLSMYTAEGWAVFNHSPLILYMVKCPVRFHETDCIFECFLGNLKASLEY